MPIVSARLLDLHRTPDGSLRALTDQRTQPLELDHPETARASYLASNGLPQRWRGQRTFTLLDTGFRAGINFLASWRAWRDDPQHCDRLHFLAVDNHPFSTTDLARIHAHFPEFGALSTQLCVGWPTATPGFHRLEFEDGHLVLTLAFGEAIACVPQFSAVPQAIYYDHPGAGENAPDRSVSLLREIALIAAPGATLTMAVNENNSESSAETLRSHVSVAGFTVTNTKAAPHHPVILSAQLPDALPDQPAVIPLPAANPRIAVVGAGLAGSLVAERLAAQGAQVTLFEHHAAPAQETSGNLTAAMLPVLSLDDARLSRLNRAAFLYAQGYLDRLGFGLRGEPITGARCGVLQIARDAAHAQKQHDILARNGFPEDFVRWVDRHEASELAGVAVTGGGWWFAGGGWANPASLCSAALACSKTVGAIELRFNTRVSAVRVSDGGWQLLGEHASALGHFDQVVLAGASEILNLEISRHLPLFRFRGQVTHLPEGRLRGLRSVVCREGYLTPAIEGWHCVGASFHRGGEPTVRDEDQHANLDRLERMLPGAASRWQLDELSARVGFRPVSPDKVPIVGNLQTADALPQGRDLSAITRHPGLYVATGYGARGLVWAPLMAELLACEIVGEPLPIESELAGSVDPARFVSRQHADKS